MPINSGMNYVRNISIVYCCNHLLPVTLQKEQLLIWVVARDKPHVFYLTVVVRTLLEPIYRRK